jgi:hypothetical protein
MVDPGAAGVPLDRCPGGLNSMTFAHAARRIALKGLACTAVAAGTALVGCAPADVGSSPSSKQQVADFIAKEPESGQFNPGKKAPGAVKGPYSIKKRLFNPGS